MGGHAAVAVWLFWAMTIPDLGIEFELPSEVEFGVVDGSTLTLPKAAATESGAKDPSQEAPLGEGDAEKAVLKNTPNETTGNAKTDAAENPQASRRPSAGEDSLSLPPGAQLALRVDMQRVRSSPLGEDVAIFLAGIPDWELLLEGSGVKPVEDLNRLLIASPNLDRAKLVIAGEHRRSIEDIRNATERIAQVRGTPLDWHKEYGVTVGTWANKDSTPRIIALLGNQAFAIMRPNDLPRILGAAEKRAEERARPDDVDRDIDTSGLLGLDAGTVVSIEVENARLFAQGFREHVPLRISANIAEPDDGRVAMVVRGEFESRAAAERAQEFWDSTKKRYASHLRNMGMFSLGMATPLEEATIAAHNRHVTAEFHLTHSQVRVLLGLIQDRLLSWQRPPPHSHNP